MAYARIPAGKLKSTFVDLQDGDLKTTKLKNAIFYHEDLEIVKNQAVAKKQAQVAMAIGGEETNSASFESNDDMINNPEHIGFTFGFATIVEPSGETKNCFVAYSVTKQFDSSDGDWEVRKDEVGDFIAFSCPPYEVPGEITFL